MYHSKLTYPLSWFENLKEEKIASPIPKDAFVFTFESPSSIIANARAPPFPMNNFAVDMPTSSTFEHTFNLNDTLTSPFNFNDPNLCSAFPFAMDAQSFPSSSLSMEELQFFNATHARSDVHSNYPFKDFSNFPELSTTISPAELSMKLPSNFFDAFPSTTFSSPAESVVTSPTVEASIPSDESVTSEDHASSTISSDSTLCSPPSEPCLNSNYIKLAPQPRKRKPTPMTSEGVPVELAEKRQKQNLAAKQSRQRVSLLLLTLCKVVDDSLLMQ